MGASEEERRRGSGGEVAETRGRGEGDAPSGALLSAGVYAPAPRTSLGEAVAGALDLPAGTPAGNEEVDLAPLWARPELHARLVEAVAEHAADRGAGALVALTPATLPLAAPAAVRLGLPLEMPDPGEGRRPPGPAGRRPYLVAGVLRSEEAGRSVTHERPADGGPAGGCAVLRAGGTFWFDDIKALYISKLH